MLSISNFFDTSSFPASSVIVRTIVFLVLFITVLMCTHVSVAISTDAVSVVFAVLPPEIVHSVVFNAFKLHKYESDARISFFLLYSETANASCVS